MLGQPSNNPRGQTQSSEIPTTCNLPELVNGQDSGELGPWGWKESTGGHLPWNEADPNRYPATGGGDLTQGRGNEGAVQGGWTDSEQFMAAALLGYIAAEGASYAQDG